MRNLGLFSHKIRPSGSGPSGGAEVPSSGSSIALPDPPENREASLGLALLSSPKDANALVDIIAVHGLDGHRTNTWTSDNGHFWLQQSLPSELPYARIFSFGYDSKLTFSTSAATITDFAVGLLDELDNARTQSQEEGRPIIFIGHSLGGIVIKQALILSLEQQHRYGSILNSTKGIIFLGTPHRGSKLANWTTFSRDIIDIVPFGTSVVRKTLLKDLETKSNVLKTISDSFQHRALNIKITSFYERIFTMPMKRLVVDKESAVLGYPGEEALPVDADHRDICKIRTIDSQHWRSVKGALKRQLDGLDLDAKYQEAQEAQVLSTVRNPHINTEIEQRIEKLLSPANFKDEIEQRVEFEMCPDTARWVLANKMYLKWRRDVSCGVFWLHGGPGSGKSFLTSFVFSQLLGAAIPGHSAVAYFACDRLVRDKPRSKALILYNTLIAQFLQQLAIHDEGAAKRILDDFEACQAAGQLSTPFRLWKNMTLATSSFKQSYMLIDGLDENEEWKDILALSKRIVSESGGRTKLFISSRSWDTIRELITDVDKESSTSIALDDGLMLADVKAFVAWKIRDLDTRDLGGKQAVLEDLVAGADGLMLLARYRTEYFMRQTGEGKADLGQVLKFLPQEVNDYYSQSMVRIKGLPDQQRIIATKIFIWITFSNQVLSFRELAEALSFHLRGHAASKDNVISRELLDKLCQGLVVLHTDFLRLSHGSVFNYLIKEGLPSLTDEYSQSHRNFDENMVHAELGTVLMNYLCCCPNPDLEAGKTWSQATTREYPLLDYAINCWPLHAFSAKRIVPSAFAKFMKSPQHRHWWQCWSQDVEAHSSPNSYKALQGLFHMWIDSFFGNEARGLIELAGPDLPLRMTEEKLRYLEGQANGEDESHISNTLAILTMMYVENGQLDAALKSGEKALSRLKGKSNRGFGVAGCLARIYGLRGDRRKEVELKEQVVDFAKSNYGLNHVQTIIALDNLALGRLHLGQKSQANEDSLEAVKYAEQLLGNDHPETIAVMCNRAVILLDMNCLDEALPIAEVAWEKLAQTLGTAHQKTIIALDNLATIHYARHEEDVGRKLRFRGFTVAMVSLGHDHPTTRQIFFELENEFQEKEDYEALGRLREYRMLHFVDLYGEDDPRTLRAMNEVLLVYMTNQNWEEAKKVGQRLVDNLRVKKYDVDDGHLWRAAIQKMTKVYDFLGDYEKGIALGEETLSFYLERQSLEDDFGIAAARDLARMYHRVEDWGNAIRCGALAVEVATNTKGSDATETITFKKELSLAFWSAKAFQAGFDLDLDVLKTCTRLYGAIHTNTIEALLVVCEAMRSSRQKDLVFHFYEQLLMSQRLCGESGGTTQEDLEAIQHGLDELFRRAPEEWHPDMLTLQTKYLSTASASSSSRDRSTVHPGPIAPNASTSNHSDLIQIPVSSASHDVLLAYFNSTIHHWGMHAVSQPANENDSIRISEVEAEAPAEQAEPENTV